MDLHINSKDDAINFSIECYIEWVKVIHDWIIGIDIIKDLKGKNLSCWCRLDCKCHADVLLELANR